MGGKSLDNKENKKEVTKEKLKEEDGNIFGKKLRKTETVKQKIEETQLEKVHLKHHEFEVKPQDVSEEQVGSICLGEPILEKTDKTKADIKPKDSKKLKKKKPKEKDDEQEVKDSVEIAIAEPQWEDISKESPVKERKPVEVEASSAMEEDLPLKPKEIKEKKEK